jgi:NADH-quinone oxidoreductase subunit J
VNPEFVVFVIFAVAAVAGAVTLVGARNPVYSAMGLLLTMFSMAVFYVLNDAHFVAAVQVIIYAGAVMTLFLFVIMLIGVDKEETREEKIPLQRPIVAVLSGGLILLVLLAGRTAWVVFDAGTAPVGTIENIADELFGTWMLPFQATILLLTIAAVGSLALARYEGQPREAAPRADTAPPSGLGSETSPPVAPGQGEARSANATQADDGGDE